MWYSTDIEPIEGTKHILVRCKHDNSYIVLNSCNFSMLNMFGLWSYIQEPINIKTT